MRKILVVALALSLLALPSCLFSGKKMLTVKAKFGDVGDLAHYTPVMLSDVKVGDVTDISLRGRKALVTMSIDPAADVPSNVAARISRESVLGEQIVQLIVPGQAGQSASEIQNNAMISTTYVVPDVENVVRQGTEVFGAIGASDLGTMINQGGIGFAGRGHDLKLLLRHVHTITKDFSKRTGMIKQLIANINALNSQLAPHAAEESRSIVNTDRALTVLRNNSHQLADALHGLRRLSAGSRYILDRHIQQMRRFFSQMRTILGTVAGQQNSIQQLLRWAPVHNRNTQLVEYQHFNQILQDFVICGLNDNPKDPARSCNGTKAGGPH